LTGNGVPIPPGVIAVDRFVDFGQHVIATTSRTSLILRNSGEQPVNVTIMEVRGTGFALEGSCATIAPADGCTVTLVFTPPSIGTFTGALTILSNDARGPIRVDLLGQGVALPRPEIELSVDGIGFANQFITTRSPAQRITVRSVGTAPLHIGGISVTGPFELSGSCPAAMAAGTTCDLSVSFLPVTAGQSEGRLTVESDAQAGRGFAASRAPDAASSRWRGCAPCKGSASSAQARRKLSGQPDTSAVNCELFEGFPVPAPCSSGARRGSMRVDL
jgi:hypothetical protein